MSNLHYTKSGRLDMRYNSSRAAVASSSSSSSYSGSNYGGSSSSSSLHYTKSGALDMRYNSSHAAVAAAQSSSAAWVSSSSPYAPPSSSELHYTKSGALDMRYSSSRAAVAQAAAAMPPPAPGSSGLHLKKDGTPDMRYKSSRDFVNRMENLELKSSNTGKSAATTRAPTRAHGVPRDIPVTKSGAPDLRTSRAKEWVQQQARNWHPTESLPAWVPCLKDGSPDMSKAAARQFIGASPALTQSDRRDNYYEEKCLRDRLFEQMMEQQRLEEVEVVREPVPVQATEQLRAAFADVVEEKDDGGLMPTSNVMQIDYAKDLVIDTDVEPLGHGGFGTVYRGKWNGQDVAIKKLHASKLTKKDRKMFVRETLILGVLGDHPNVVQLHGYTLTPLSLVMEFVPKGSLGYLLHYCEDPEVEAKMTDGRVKLNILLGITYGMIQLHACRVTHGDLKPQNVLITDEFHAKIADFGLATFRAKAASTTSSHMLSGSTGEDDTDADFEGIAGGTAAYMAPELLDPNEVANEKTDVYSFGVLMNEVLQEEEPYQQNLRQFVGKGPFASVLFAKAGNRPVIRDEKVTPELKRLIEHCWSQKPADRPTFSQVGKMLVKCSVPHACG
jgi:predicted Ser/Thr protein kinase